MQKCPHPLIFLFGSSVKVWNMRGLKVTFEGKDFVSACLWFLFFQNILQHWVHGWVRALWKESKEKYNCESREKYKQKSGTNTERGQLGGVDFSLVQCGNSPWHVFGRFAANLVTILPKLSIYLLNKDPVWINGNEMQIQQHLVIFSWFLKMIWWFGDFCKNWYEGKSGWRAFDDLTKCNFRLNAKYDWFDTSDGDSWRSTEFVFCLEFWNLFLFI